jgi:hypothetical protein
LRNCSKQQQKKIAIGILVDYKGNPMYQTTTNPDHANGKVECRNIEASKEAIGDDSNSFKCFTPINGGAQVTIHLQAVPLGTGVVKVHNADVAMY